MDCPRCSEALDPGASFCGNCGQAVTVGAAMAVAKPGVNDEMPSMAELVAQPPAYAVADPVTQKAGARAMLALILSVLALPAAILPVLGWPLAALSIAIARSAGKHTPHKRMSTVATSFAALAIVLAGAAFVFNITQYQKQKSAMGQPPLAVSEDQASSQATHSSLVDTPCYSLDAAGLPNIQHLASSCNAQAFNAATMDAATNAFNIEAVRQDKITEANLAEAGREVANSYLQTALPNLTVTSQGAATFAGSPAYIITGRNADNVWIEMALVLHKVAHGENVFVLAHAINDQQADLSQFETSWEWK